MFTVTFTGFRTLEQAKAFAAWYSGAGEQDAPLWMEEHAGVTSCYAEKLELAPDGAGVTVALNVVEAADRS